MDYTPTRIADEHTRRLIARELSRYYHELADHEDKPEPRFSLARCLEEMAHPNGLSTGFERELCSATASAAGESFDRHRVRIPIGALARELTVASSAGGGYLVATESGALIDLLRPWSVAAQAGANVLPSLTGNLVLPRVTSAPQGGWVAGETAQYTEGQPTLGQAALAPKHVAVWPEFSRQWRQQTDGGERVLRSRMMRAVGELLDVAFFAGTGVSGQPLGLLNTPGIGTQSGTSLAHAGILAMRQAVLAAGGQESALRWVGDPDTQELLGARERSSGGGRFLWDDNGVLGRPAHSTKNAPSDTLTAGDFSAAVIGLWGPTVLMEVNPYQDFKAGILAARVVLTCDVAFPVPSAFCVASSIT